MKPNVILLFLLLLGGQLSQAITVRFPRVSGYAGDTITVPMYVDDDLTGSNIKSFQFDIGYTSSNAQLLDVSTVGTVSSAFTELDFIAHTDYITIAGAGSTALAGSGVLLNFRFKLISSGSSLIFRNEKTSNFFNEGTPTMSFTTGYVTINARPVIYVNPSTTVLAIGETQQFYAGNGTAPYTWSTSDNHIASITANGMLTALESGTITVTATDANGFSGTSGMIECRNFYATIRDTSFYQNNFVDVPFLLNNLDAMPMHACQFVLTFNEGVLSFDTLVSTGTLIAGGVPVECSHQSGKIRVAVAFSAPLTNGGTLFKLRFKVADIPSGATYIVIDEATINEAIQPKTKNGYFSVRALPALSVSPSSIELFTGDSKQFNVSGGTPPYTWEVENSSLASTTNTGLLTALAGGTTKLTVRDVYGSTGSSAVTLYDTWVGARDSSVDVEASYQLTIPVEIGKIPSGKGIWAFYGNVNTSFAKIDSLKVSTFGTKTEGWLIATTMFEPRESYFALCHSSAIVDAGRLLNLTIWFNNTLRTGDAFYINCPDWTFNEGVPAVKARSGRISIKSIQTQLDEPQEADVCVYPVPVRDNLFIDLPPDYACSVLSVYDLSGKQLISKEVRQQSGSTVSLPVRSLRKGLYLLNVQGERGGVVVKFSKVD